MKSGNRIKQPHSCDRHQHAQYVCFCFARSRERGIHFHVTLERLRCANCLRFGLIRELRLSTNHFHCITDGSTKLDYDKCIFDLHEIFFEREVGIRSIGDLGFSDLQNLCLERCLVRVFVVAFLCPASNFPRPRATLEACGTMRRKHFYKRTCTYGSDTAC